ncbi:MAG: SDR family oxidoreductase [Clostridiales bacterium]|nr:SDR family oxidoreductase [Clostridiales bacterium]
MKKKILVTGASRGLGFNITRKYLENGETVFAGARDITSEKLQALKENYPDTLIPITLDVTDTASVNAAAKSIGSYTEHLDVIINNAAIHSPTSFEILERADIDDCMATYDVNSLGPLRVVKACLSLIRNGDGAKIINISSESGSIGACGRDREFDYCMTKAALNMGTKLLANYLNKDKILVLAVHPGWMRTDMGGPNAHLDPYEAACQLVELFEKRNTLDGPIFIDNEGEEYPW